MPVVHALVYHQNITAGENNPMNRFDSQVHKSSGNSLDFSLRNKDRKPINLIDKTLTAHITNIDNKELKLSKELEILDSAKGFARLNLSASEINNWDVGFYSYAIAVKEDNGREGFTNTDQAGKVVGSFELFDDALPQSTGAIEVTSFNLQTISAGNQLSVSGSIISNGTNLHTFAWYFSKFIGEFKVEATMDSTPSTDADAWTEVYANTSGNEQDGIVSHNVSGLYTFFRLTHKETQFNTGTVTKVLYK